ncbi:MAG: type II toxin-antitoxin system RelE/ParE family toxin [Candidatus Thermoplasmatota archaeon]|nr:type II toxin-antitoxin system RelE/ParE family toxin [Candidatus Thermoplasmatota archaeon]
MLEVEYRDILLKTISNINDESIKQRVKKQIKKIVEKPDIGKPMRYSRKNTREVYIGSYRLAYAYLKNKIIFLDLYHKDKQ